MQLKKSKWIYLVSSIAIFSAMSLSFITHGQETSNPCCPTVYKTPKALTQCHASNKSWVSWLTGNSRSAQFHYLDLLELLSSNEIQETTKADIESQFK